MQALKLLNETDGSLLSDYASRMGEALLRRQADIEIRAARVEAELAIKARSEFLANMNHELRTPLNAIIGFATMLRDNAQYEMDDEQRSGYAEYILQSADLLLGHINTVLEVAALESGGVELNDDEFDLGETLDAALERTTIRAQAAKISISRRDDKNSIAAWGDAERFGQAIDHLLQAAIKACDEGGRILVRACLDESGWPEIAVRDDGAGLTPEETNEALEAFKQVHRGLDRTFSGPGVGYAVAKTFVEMQRGKFTIKSRKGKGTLVRISLPPPNAKPSAINIEAPAPEDPRPPTEIDLERKDDAA
ncbi:MAG: HAMP domain-containing histidine kinase [Marinicaulis sp.]|nr:HAMP domain-containing histidine kinase [Marinicaulis sp.]NNE42239.1 HAMP domain-containing histidine kinase [Marinicaulis sp.]NNL89135.1 HAMP domain-containing histidine kinase [Marinicaulis sp.]